MATVRKSVKPSFNILLINPGSTSTKIELFEGEKQIFSIKLSHSSEELSPYARVAHQYEFRKNIVLSALKEHQYSLKKLDAVVGRGGLLKPITSGTYEVSENMLHDLKEATFGEHASNLGGIMAFEIAKEAGCKSFIVDPVVVDELDDIARLSGNPHIPRISIFHALNQKAVGRKAANDLKKKYEDINLIVVHMGGGISVGMHRKGRVVDVNNALDGEGPFSPERSGGVPIGQLTKLCFSGKFTEKEIKSQITGKGGLVAYLGTNDAKKVQERFEKGDKEATLIYSAMAYQIAKEIGQLATVVEGKVDAICLTGGLAYDKNLTGMIEKRVSFITKVMTYPGEGEMESLKSGALRVLSGEDTAKRYL